MGNGDHMVKVVQGTHSS